MDRSAKPPSPESTGATFTIPLPSAPTKLRHLKLKDGAVLTEDDGVHILEGMSDNVHVTSVSDFLVLGVEELEGPSSLADIPLGSLRCRRWLACARNKMWWMTPEWGTTAKELPPETQFLLLELDDGGYAIMLPLIDNDTFRGTLRSSR